MVKQTFLKNQHEFGVDRFYSSGVKGFHDYHGGYLNFGWWENATGYIEAAEELVRKTGMMLGLNNKSRLLDVGCGMGTQDIFLQSHFGPNIIEALDATWKHVCISRERVLRSGMENYIKVHHGTATKLPFAVNSFTHIMSIEGSEHFDTREDFFKEAFRVLKSKGVMVLADFSIKRQAKTLWEKLVVKATQKLWHVPKTNVYDLKVYNQKLAQAGFKNIIISEVGEHTIPGYINEQRKKETIKQIRKTRGWIALYGGFFINYLIYKAFKNGLAEYIFVWAEKP